MQSMKYLINWLSKNADNEHYLFKLQDLRSLLPDLSSSNFKTLLSRTVRAGYLGRVCRGLYIDHDADPKKGFLLFHAASLLRANEFNYISFETVLSDVGIISQIPINRISIMSSGRSNVIDCGEFGTIEFIHTKRKPSRIMGQLYYDQNCKLWRAGVSLALKDMRLAKRNCDLINWDIANDFI
jgi:predicted transcriptional regulator of viral defense system